MIILSEQDIKNTAVNWDASIGAIRKAVECLDNEDFAQPVKPYLRYRDLKNRIIAMPAFAGGNINMAGIKWIASFPGNVNQGIPRAHSVMVLNDAATGEPVAIFNTALPSIIRTASVSGLVIKCFEQVRELDNITLGITGFGPIGRYHLKMCIELLKHKLKNVLLYDIRPIDPDSIGINDKRITVADSWQEAYRDADIFITCTVSDAPYIDLPPKPGSLHLNVSLRDYSAEACEWFKNALFVDNWEEVCREKTDIEMMHLKKGLRKEDTKSITDLVMRNALAECPGAAPVMFNPMGMAVFDIAIGHYYYMEEKSKEAEKNGKNSLVNSY